MPDQKTASNAMNVLFTEDPLDIQNELYGINNRVLPAGSQNAVDAAFAAALDQTESSIAPVLIQQAPQAATVSTEADGVPQISSGLSVDPASDTSDPLTTPVRIASADAGFETSTFTDFQYSDQATVPQPAQTTEVAAPSSPAAAIGPATEVTAGFGNDNPAVSFNLESISDFGTADPFLDISKTMRAWIGHKPGEWGGFSYGELKNQGYLDEDGWVKKIPDGLESVGTIWDWKGGPAAADRAGVYVMTYEGEGTIKLFGGAKVLSHENGKIVFENAAGSSMWYNITETDPGGTGDYLRDISIVHEKNLDLYEAGAVFNPKWLDLISDAREFRFMAWSDTNNSNLSAWEDRPTADSANWTLGAPVEVMVQLANEAGVDPWFTIPPKADDNFIRKFAEYVRDNLDPNLTARVEYGNENWNWAFKQTRWLADKALEEWGDSSSAAFIDYHSMRATQTGAIWQDVFAESTNSPNLVNVLGVQTVNPWAADRLLSGVVWKVNDPDGWIDPASVFDELAGTSYFGNSVVESEVIRQQLLDAIADPNVDANAWLAAKLVDPAFYSSIPHMKTKWLELKEVADKYDLGLVSYEGGQHVHHSFAVSGLTKEEISGLTNFMIQFVRSPEMADLYSQLWDAWADVSDGAFMQLGEVGVVGKFGSWALLSNLNDSNPRADFLLDQLENADAWWGTTPNQAYLQGVTTVGTDADDEMFGTDQEDYLAGGAGNDRFITGKGRDGINGGAGSDSLVLAGVSSEYSIKASGKGYLLNGPEGEKFVINLETFEFSNGESLTLNELLIQSGETPGTTAPNDQGSTDTPGDETSFALDLSGAIRDAGNIEAVSIARSANVEQGIFIQSIIRNGELGKELGLTSNDHDRGYAVFDTENSASFRDSFGDTWKLTTAEDTAANAAGLSVIDSALQFGDIVLDPARIIATSGRDWFIGQDNDETVEGRAGNDYLDGRRGDDTLYGGDDRDTIYGGKGKDLVVGGKGSDVLSGGGGADRYYFAAGDGDDRILDFHVNDVLEFENYLTPGQNLSDGASLNAEGDLVISNGSDQITFEGLNLDDLDWITVV